MIPKGCTCENSFSIPYDKEEIATLLITYQQNKVNVVEKTLDDCSFVDGKIYIVLSQEDTLKFNDEESIEIQIRIKLNNGVVTKCKIIKTYTDRVLNDGVI